MMLYTPMVFKAVGLVLGGKKNERMRSPLVQY